MLVQQNVKMLLLIPSCFVDDLEPLVIHALSEAGLLSEAVYIPHHSGQVNLCIHKADPVAPLNSSEEEASLQP